MAVEGGANADVSLVEQDAALLSELARLKYQGPLYEAFEARMWRYGLGVMMMWLAEGEIFALSRRGGRPLPASPRPLSREEREQLATDTVAATWRRFKAKALLGGEWTPAGGAAVTTYFARWLISDFANVYRSLLVRIGKDDHEVPTGHIGEIADARSRAWISDPGDDFAGRETYDELLALADPVLRRILLLRIEGHSHAQIGQEVGMSARSIEGRIRRFRDRVQQVREQDGEQL